MEDSRSKEQLHKEYDKIIKGIEKEQIDAFKNIQKTLGDNDKVISKLLRDKTSASKEEVDSLEESIKALRNLKNEADSMVKGTTKASDELRSSAEEMLKSLGSLVDKQEEVSDSLTKTWKSWSEEAEEEARRAEARSSKSFERARKNSEDLLKSLQKSNNIMDSEYSKFEKRRTTFFKKLHAENLKEESERAEDLVRNLENYRDKYYDDLTTEEKENFKERFEQYKKNAEDLKELSESAGDMIRNSLSEKFSEIVKDARDLSIVSSLGQGLSEQVDSYMTNKRQLRTFAGDTVSDEVYDGVVKGMQENTGYALSRQEASDIATDIVKSYSVKDAETINTDEIGAQVKAFGTSVDSFSNIAWADSHSGMNGELYLGMSNIAAALQTNVNLNTTATQTLEKLNENADLYQIMEKKRGKKVGEISEAVASIDAIQQTVANQGVTALTSQMEEWMVENPLSLNEDDTFQMFKYLSGYGDKTNEEIQNMLMSEEGSFELINGYTKTLQSMSDEAVNTMQLNGQLVGSYQEVQALRGLDEKGMEDIENSIRESFQEAEQATDNGESLTSQLAENAESLVTKLSNQAWSTDAVTKVTDGMDDLGFSFSNIATILTGIKSGIDLFKFGKSTISKFSGAGKAVESAASAVGDAASAASDVVTEAGSAAADAVTEAGTVASDVVEGTIAEAGTVASESLLSVLGPILGFTGLTVGGLYAADKASEKSREDYAKENKTTAGYETKSVQQMLMDIQSVQGSDGVLQIFGDANNFARCLENGWITVEDTNSDGILDSWDWVGKAFDYNSMSFDKDGNVWDSNGDKVEPYANGLSYVPNDGLAYIHEGEAVLTKSQAVQARADGGIEGQRVSRKQQEVLDDIQLTLDGILETEALENYQAQDFREQLCVALFGAKNFYNSTDDGFLNSLSNAMGFTWVGSDIAKANKELSSGTYSVGGSGKGNYSTTGANGMPSEVASTLSSGSSLSTGNDSSTSGYTFSTTGANGMPSGVADDMSDGTYNPSSGSIGAVTNQEAFDVFNSRKDYQKEFIYSILPGALETYKQYGILPSVTLAQAACESGWGKSSVGNNIFGIKANSSWDGPTTTANTPNDAQKVSVFRDYDSIESSVLDHGAFLAENSRYTKAGLFDGTNFDEQASAIASAGYAEASNYYETLRSFAYGDGLTAWDPPSYDVGTEWVPNDQLAMVHEGEMIVPADMNPLGNTISSDIFPDIQGGSQYDDGNVIDSIQYMVYTLAGKLDAVVSAVKSSRSGVYRNSQSDNSLSIMYTT